jgi:hypothetical protein
VWCRNRGAFQQIIQDLTAIFDLNPMTVTAGLQGILHDTFDIRLPPVDSIRHQVECLKE